MTTCTDWFFLSIPSPSSFGGSVHPKSFMVLHTQKLTEVTVWSGRNCPFVSGAFQTPLLCVQTEHGLRKLTRRQRPRELKMFQLDNLHSSWGWDEGNKEREANRKRSVRGWTVVSYLTVDLTSVQLVIWLFGVNKYKLSHLFPVTFQYFVCFDLSWQKVWTGLGQSLYHEQNTEV